MSDGPRESGSANLTGLGFVIALIAAGWALICIVVNDSQANAIRNLQHRIAVLEQKRYCGQRLST